MSDYSACRDGDHRWHVRERADGPSLSTHHDEREAIREAVRRARESGGGTVSVHGADGRLHRRARVGGAAGGR
jgi:hypothetical protein